mmetsp:Transcript_26272/g.25111  ORF Transcript_26272/g.25111 Transcript_26272/m.25111 type:complete len:85 (+) Transcript_26272:103-357(+)
MPWQTAPALIIIGGAFMATGVLLPLIDNIAYGRNRRVGIDEFIFNLDARDVYISDLKQKRINDEKQEIKKLAALLKQAGKINLA